MRFISNKKAILVIAVLLATILFLSGCAPSPTNASSPTSRAPDFLVVGSYYQAVTSAESPHRTLYFKVLEIRNDGWILVEDSFGRKKFVNPAQLILIWEIERFWD